MVRNRAVGTIDVIDRDAFLTATGKSGVVHLPAVVRQRTRRARLRGTGMGGQGRNAVGGLLFADRLTDILQPLRRHDPGLKMNHAFFGVTGEETSSIVFVQCMTTDWIDGNQRTVRHAELNQTTPHRPGLLDGTVLRATMEQRHEILRRASTMPSFIVDVSSTLIDTCSKPRSPRHARPRLGPAAACRAAENVIATHDRPLRRRKHEQEIQTAQRQLQRQPNIIRRADATIAAAESKLTELGTQTGEARPIPPAATNSSDVSPRSTVGSLTTGEYEPGSPDSNNRQRSSTRSDPGHEAPRRHRHGIKQPVAYTSTRQHSTSETASATGPAATTDPPTA